VNELHTPTVRDFQPLWCFNKYKIANSLGIWDLYQPHYRDFRRLGLKTVSRRSFKDMETLTTETETRPRQSHKFIRDRGFCWTSSYWVLAIIVTCNREITGGLRRGRGTSQYPEYSQIANNVSISKVASWKRSPSRSSKVSACLGLGPQYLVYITASLSARPQASDCRRW